MSVIGKAAAVLSPKGSTVGVPASSKQDKGLDEDMPDAEPIQVSLELIETLRVKLPNTYSGNWKELEVFLL